MVTVGDTYEHYTQVPDQSDFYRNQKWRGIRGRNRTLDFVQRSPEFKGQAGHWTPEHFLITAVASCYVSTFSGMAFNSDLEFLSLELEADGTLVQDQTGWLFQEVVLHPRLTIARAEQKALGSRLLNKAKENCLVGRSLACPVVVEPALIIEEQPVVSV